MKEKFCMECGTPHPPHAKFCGTCRNQFEPSSVAAKPTPPANPNQTPRQVTRPAPKMSRPAEAQTEDTEETELEDEGESVAHVPQVQGLDIDITPGRTIRGEPLGSFAGSVERPDTFQRPKEKKLSRKAFLEQWKKEAGTLRPKEKQ